MLSSASTINALRFSINRCPAKHSVAAVLLLLRYSRASGSVVEAWVSFDRFSPCHCTSVLRPAGGSDGGPSFGLKLLCDAHAFNRVPSTVK